MTQISLTTEQILEFIILGVKNGNYDAANSLAQDLLKSLKERNISETTSENMPINIVFDGPPGKDAGKFVEVETDGGKNINVGEWKQKGNYWILRITELPKA